MGKQREVTADTISTLRQLEIETTDAFILMDTDGIVTKVNPMFEQMFGWTFSEVVGKKLSIVPPHLRQEHSRLLQRALSGEHVKAVETFRMSKWGPIEVRLCLTPMRDSQGEIVAIAGVVRDLRRRKDYEKQLAQTVRKLGDVNYALNISSVVQIYHPNGRVKYVNNKFAQLSGYRKRELLGSTFLSLLAKPINKRLIGQAIDALSRGATWKGELIYHAKDGSPYWLDVTAVPLYDEQNQVYEYIVIGTDITQKKRAEEMLRKSEKLVVIGELAAGIAHEIRNPLTSLKGFVQMMKKGMAQRDEYLQIMEAELERINDIIGELLLLAKPQKTEKELIQAGELIESTVKLLEAQAAMQNVQIQTHVGQGSLALLGNGNQLKQAFINILKNAIEASAGPSVIHVTVQRQENDELLIRFRDEGCGIPQEILHKLGEPYFSTKEKGTGLGLVVTYKIIQEHKGKIRVVSKQGRGTVFDVLLPSCGLPAVHNES